MNNREPSDILYGMEEVIYKRVILEAEYILENKSTLRATAKEMGICKSTVHKDLTVRLPEYDGFLAEEVRKLLDFNLSVRHIRGGEARRKHSAAFSGNTD